MADMSDRDALRQVTARSIEYVRKRLDEVLAMPAVTFEDEIRRMVKFVKLMGRDIDQVKEDQRL